MKRSRIKMICNEIQLAEMKIYTETPLEKLQIWTFDMRNIKWQN